MAGDKYEHGLERGKK